jgi:hypothetical protein
VNNKKESEQGINHMATEAQINANRENSKFSHGPVTPEGKETCSKNALKHALTGLTVLLPTDDLAAYEKLCAILDKKFAPETDAEKLMVESISETEWRLQRIDVIHSGIFALGRLQHKNDFADEEDLAPAERAAIIETLIFKEGQKELNNLAMLQGRLQRHLERRTKDFEQLRTERETVQMIRRKVPPSPPHALQFSRSQLGKLFSLARKPLKKRRLGRLSPFQVLPAA